MRYVTKFIAVCAVATVLASDASAQRRGGWSGGYRQGGGNYRGGWSGGYYNSPRYGYGYNNFGYNNFGYNNYGYYPNYRSGYYSSYPNYYYSYPSYSSPTYSDYNPGYYSQPSTSLYQPSNSATVTVRVLLPDPNARLTIQGQEMTLTGQQRDFVSAPLEVGRSYTYTIVATWNANGQMVTREKRVDVTPGQSVLVDFNVD